MSTTDEDEIKENIKKNATKENATNNLFSVLGIGTKELLHSRFIAFLLAPYGKVHSGNSEKDCFEIYHNYKNGFLRDFLKVLYGDYKTFLGEYGVAIERFDTAEVFIEYEDEELEGRIDILLKLDTFWIGIENKIYANDQEGQLKRYHDFLTRKTNKNFELIYLTLDGRDATDLSTNGLKKDKDYITCSYDKIKTWIGNVYEKTFDDDLQPSIEQYSKSLDVLLEKHTLCNDIKGNSNEWINLKLLRNILEKSGEEEKVKDYTKDLLINYVYPSIINSTIAENYHKIDKEIEEGCFLQENNTFIVYVSADKSKEYDLYFEFTVDLKVIYYPIVIDNSGKKRYLWGKQKAKDQKEWKNWGSKNTHKSWNIKHDELQDFIQIFNKTIKKDNWLKKDIEDMRKFIKDSIGEENKYPLPPRKK